MLGTVLAVWLGGTAMAADVDENLWLEEVLGEDALAWARKHTDATRKALAKGKAYKQLQGRVQRILESDDKIPFVAARGGWLYNFWQDAKHPQGLWRRTTWEAYRAGDDAAWQVLLDLDALSAAEGQRWVWHGADCLAPAYERCLVALSPGGSDADVVREFDVATKAFVQGGFTLPEAKGEITWLDADTTLVTRVMGPGTETTSGYPRQVRRWARGAPLQDAPVVYEGLASDVSAYASVDHTPGFERTIVGRAVTFWTSEQHLLTPDGLVRLDVPDDANASLVREWLVVELRSPWEVGGATFPAGALVVTRLDAFLAGERSFEAVFTPTPTTALAGWSATRSALVLNVLDDVRSKVFVLQHGDAGWSQRQLPGLPAFGEVNAGAVDPLVDDRVFVTVTDFLTPTTLGVMDAVSGEAPEVLRTTPAMFDAAGLTITQRFATSQDGTRVPYFLVHREDVPMNGSTPTLLYGYGGFEVSMTPSYGAVTGAAWLERGGAYALANIRGGGEYGPAWHQAALKEHRHRAYEDFAAVARDLVASGLTSKEHLGAMGGSNGGLLMGNMLTQYPELFGAIVCQVPLLDMQRYHKLLAGASWMGEYGDPDDPAQWAYIQTFSPYHLLRSDADYPKVLFMTSTRDDRVHPGHARKMVARMKAQGHDVLYWENTEGGHGGAANAAQRAEMWSLAWTFLDKALR